MTLGIPDKQPITTLEKMEDGKAILSVMVSNDVSCIKYFAATLMNYGIVDNRCYRENKGF